MGPQYESLTSRRTAVGERVREAEGTRLAQKTIGTGSALRKCFPFTPAVRREFGSNGGLDKMSAVPREHNDIHGGDAAIQTEDRRARHAWNAHSRAKSPPLAFHSRRNRET